MRIRITFACLLFIPALCHGQEKFSFRLEPQKVIKVAETTALGYGNGRKLISDPEGTMYFSAVGQAPNGLPGVCVIRTVKKEGTATDFEKLWIENSNGVITSAQMHFASSLASYGAGPFYVVWTGGDGAKPNDPNLAHQLRFAEISTSGTMKMIGGGEPITISGFDEVYRAPFLESQLWQEFPSAFVSKDGRLHVVWEARDKRRRMPNGALVPAIAYAVRDASGVWSTSGKTDTPPYLDVESVHGPQFRPYMLTDDAGTLHVLCYGVIFQRTQILYGQLAQGKFSGWKAIAPADRDQRHVSASIDAKGRIHAAWRQGGPANKLAFIFYSMRNTDGSWTPPIQINDSTRMGSTPNITVDDKATYVVWTGWKEGFENSDSQKDNGFPGDSDTVEGNLEFSTKRFEDNQFSSPVILTGGTGSYPRIARVRNSSPPQLAVIWTLGSECLPHSCVEINYGHLATPTK